MARIPYADDAQFDEKTKHLIGQLAPLNIFKMMAHCVVISVAEQLIVVSSILDVATGGREFCFCKSEIGRHCQ